MLFKKENKDVDERLVEKKRWYKLMLHLLTRAFNVSVLKWYELITVVVLGAFCGLGIGLIIGNFIFRTPKVVVIPINQTHIVRVNLP